MTHTAESLAALPDSELNRLAAEVMGWPVIEYRDIEYVPGEGGYYPSPTRSYPAFVMWRDSEIGIADSNLGTKGLWSPSTNANQAIELAEEVCKNINGDWNLGRRMDNKYQAHLYDMNAPIGFYNALGATPARSLTIASILASQAVQGEEE